MNLSEPFIARPVATTLLMIAVVLLGLLGYRSLPISALPAVEFPTIQVTTQLPGASPEVMESLVTTPLERQFGLIAGLNSMNSNSAFGLSTITLQFVLDRDIDNAAQDVQSAINAARGTLPANLPYPPVYNKVNPADTPILQLAVSSDTLPIDAVADFADSVLGQKLSQVSGVGLVSIQGNLRPAVRVQANPATLAGLGLALADVRTALTQANVNSPKGTFDGPQQSFTIGSNDQIVSAEAYRPVIVAYRNGAAVRLSDIATVTQGVENEQLAAWASVARLASTARCATDESAGSGFERANASPKDAPHGGGAQRTAMDGRAGGCESAEVAPGTAGNPGKEGPSTARCVTDESAGSGFERANASPKDAPHGGGARRPAMDGRAGGCESAEVAPGTAGNLQAGARPAETRAAPNGGTQTPSVLIDIQRQPGVNIIETVDRIKKILPQLTASFPASVKVQILSDRTETIRASVHDVQFTLLLTVALVVMVIFVFLRKLWATVIPSVALPLSIIGTFGLMSLAGFSLDNLSLMALTIATGFVVDDAIVMIENIVRYLELGEKARRGEAETPSSAGSDVGEALAEQGAAGGGDGAAGMAGLSLPEWAARAGARQIGFTVVSLTVSLIAVFIPLLFMSGVIGRLFREFALVLTIAVLLSAFISLTLTPMMCAKLLKAETAGHAPKPGGAFAWSERQFERLLAGYEASLRWVMQRPRTTMLVFASTLVLTAGLYVAIPKGLLPQQDTGVILGVAEASQSISFPAMRERVQALTDVVREDPDVASVSAFVGSGTVNPTLNTGRISVVLKPRAQRRAGAEAIIARLREATAGVQGVSLYMQPVQDLQIDSRVSRTQFQYTLQSLDAGDLGEWTPKLLAALAADPALADVTSDQQASGLYLRLSIDRDRASRLGVSVQAIDDALYDAFGQRQVSTIFTQQNQYRVVLEVPPEFRDGPEALDKLYVKSSGSTTPNGVAASTSLSAVASNSNVGATSVASSTMVPLSAVARAERVSGPLVISHQAQLPAATISFNLAPGHSLSDALPAIEAAQQRIGLPPTITPSFSGVAAEFSSALSSMPLLILAAIIVIYIVLGVLYESYIHPLTILSTLPSAGVGALLALMLTRQDFTVVALIGVILLIGIVKKNAIMMIDFALEAERDHGKTPQAAIFEAALLRFRPIMMTTMAALLGALPLAFESGTGSELRNPLGCAIVGGLLLSQLLTLYTTPVIYLYMDRLARRFRQPPRADGALAPAASPPR